MENSTARGKKRRHSLDYITGNAQTRYINWELRAKSSKNYKCKDTGSVS